MNTVDEALIEEGLRILKDPRFNITFLDLCAKKGFKDIFSEAINSRYLVIFWALFVLNGVFLIYSAFLNWQIRTVRDVVHYFPRIRKHAGCLVGFCAVLICSRIISSEEFCGSAMWIVLFSSLLSGVAVWIAYGTRGRPHILVPIVVIAFALLVFVSSFASYIKAGLGQDYVPKSVFGLIHTLIGLILLGMNRRDGPPVRGQPWHLRNGNPYRMEE